MYLSDQKFIAKLSFNFNFNLVGSWDSFILTLTIKTKTKIIQREQHWIWKWGDCQNGIDLRLMNFDTYPIFKINTYGQSENKAISASN